MITESEKEQLNHQAYDDVFELEEPSMPDNEFYMESYYFWYSIAHPMYCSCGYCGHDYLEY